MKKLLIACVILAGLAVTAAHAEEVPRTLAGVTLGEDFSKYENLCRMDFFGNSSDILFLKEAPLKHGAIPGIRGGDLYTTTCAHPNKVVRIKLKFMDRSKDLFEDLLKRYKKRYGDPDSYKGDAFRNVIVWEWVIKDDTRNVNLTLTYSIDPEFRPGVTVKMTDVTMLREDYKCYLAKHPGKKRKKMKHRLDLDDYVPR